MAERSRIFSFLGSHKILWGRFCFTEVEFDLSYLDGLTRSARFILEKSLKHFAIMSL